MIKPSPYRKKKVNSIYKWLSPGIFVKRWLLTSFFGILLLVLGVAIWSKLTPVYRIIEFIFSVFDKLTTYFPNHISGPVVILLGLFLLLWGQTRTLNSITEVLTPDREDDLIEVLWNYRPHQKFRLWS